MPETPAPWMICEPENAAALRTFPMKMSNTEGFDLLTKWCDETRTVGFTICSGLAPAMAIAQGLGRLSPVGESAATITVGFVATLIEAQMGESAASGIVKSLEITIPLDGAE
jgi:hypothetical protein